jgi:hypothetical protein
VLVISQILDVFWICYLVLILGYICHILLILI